MIDRYELTTELGNDMVCDGWGVIPCISLSRMTVVTCLGCSNHVSLNQNQKFISATALFEEPPQKTMANVGMFGCSELC